MNKRYTEYAGQLEAELGVSKDILISLTFNLIRACVHYAMFRDEFYLKSQTSLLKSVIAAKIEEISAKK